MKTITIALLGIPVAGLIAWQPTAQKDRTAAQQMAAVVSSVLPKTVDGGAVIRSAEADGDTLVITSEVPSTQFWSSEEYARMAGAAFCQRPNVQKYFQTGGKLRFDISMGGGAPSHGDVIDHCPSF